MRKTVYSKDEIVDVLQLEHSDALYPQLNDLSNERIRIILSELVDDLTIIVGRHNAGKWLRTPNDAFQGARALDIIELGIGGAEQVQKYVKAVAINPW